MIKYLSECTAKVGGLMINPMLCLFQMPWFELYSGIDGYVDSTCVTKKS
jgi:hypothetical protein